MRNLLSFISLTCALLCVGIAEARRMSPEALEAAQVHAQKPKNIMVKPPVIVNAGNGAQSANKLEKAGQRVWQSQVHDLATWQQLSKQARDYEFSKFVIDVKTDKIYFVDSNVFTLHSDFVLDYLQKLPRTAANIKQYNRNYSRKKPQFILGYLTHYPNLQTWTFSFWEGDTIDAPTIRRAANKLKNTFTVADLKFRPDSSYQENIAKGLKQSEVPVIKNTQIYRAMPYQAFNTGRSVGLLNIVSPSQQVENMQFDPHEIVILQQSYPDISPVAGIITTQFSTPLSHVNLRATAWNIPNASFKTALQEYGKFKNKWVYLEVAEQAISLRLATEVEIQQEQKKRQSAKQVKLPQANIHYTSLDDLRKISLEHAQKFGAKTAHLGEMRQAGFPVPNGFGIPFYYYQQHIAQHRMDIDLQDILNDERFKKNKVWRKQKLLELQAKIKNTPINPVHFAAIKKQWNEALDGASVFVRSSTNAEDLAGFNGAGLYDTVPNVKSDIALEAAIKKVWASLWNERAVSERAFFGIPQNQVYAAVLVQMGVNAAASGVLLTTDIWGHQPRTFTLNAKWGLGMRVVEGQKIAEQILYDTGNDGARVISRSDEDTMLVFDAKGGTREIKVPKSEAIITEQRAKKLGQLAQQLEALFPSYKVLDIEWVLEKTNLGQDKFWLVQARPYID